MFKTTGILEFPKRFELTHSVELFRWSEELKHSPKNEVIKLSHKDGEKLFFKFSSEVPLAEYLGNGQGLGMGPAWEKLVTELIKKNIVLEFEYLEHDTAKHTTTSNNLKMIPSYGLPQLTVKTSERNYTDYQLYVFGFEPAISIYSEFGKLCLLNYFSSEDISVIQNNSNILENGFISIWRLRPHMTVTELLNTMEVDLHVK